MTEDEQKEYMDRMINQALYIVAYALDPEEREYAKSFLKKEAPQKLKEQDVYRSIDQYFETKGLN